MNLHQVASGVVAAVNPLVTASLLVSTGSVPNADGSRTPTFAAPVSVGAQVQPLSTGDIRQLESLNIQGAERAIYLNGAVSGLVRVANKGGDLIVLPDGNTWLVKAVLEQWPDWVKCAVILQNGS